MPSYGSHVNPKWFSLISRRSYIYFLSFSFLDQVAAESTVNAIMKLCFTSITGKPMVATKSLQATMSARSTNPSLKNLEGSLVILDPETGEVINYFIFLSLIYENYHSHPFRSSKFSCMYHVSSYLMAKWQSKKISQRCTELEKQVSVDFNNDTIFLLHILRIWFWRYYE